MMAAGFAAVSGVAAACLWAGGALGAYWREVWEWGRLYAGGTFVAEPWKNGLARTLNWMGFHAAAIAAAACFFVKLASAGDRRAAWRWGGWLALALIGVAPGLRFFPRYYFLVLPVVALMAARGFATMGRRACIAVGLLLIVPVVRFAPSYLAAAADPRWRDTAMDRDSRAAAAIIRQTARPGDTLFVWGYRPELFVYTGLRAASMYLDSQPLTGVPADRHLTQSTPVETTEARRRRAELAQLRPDIVADGLSAYNPLLAMTRYPELAAWMDHYALAGRTGETAIYRRIP